MLVLGCANENVEDDVELGAVPPKALFKGAPKRDGDCPVGFVELVPKLNPVLVFVDVVDVSVFSPKLNPLTGVGFDCPSENVFSVGVALFCPNEKPLLLPLPKAAKGEDCGSCMAGVSFFSTLRVGLSSIPSPATSIPSPLSAVDSAAFGVLGVSDVPTLPNPPKTDLGGSGARAFATP